LNGDGELTRDVLRAELRAGLAEQTIAWRREMDARFEPVNAFIADQQQGNFTDAQQAAILKTVKHQKDDTLFQRSLKAPLVGLGIALCTLGMMVVSVLVAAGVIGSGPH